MEILVASLVLGFLFTALLQLQLGNRNALLRIRSRDAAIDVAQEVIDSLSNRSLDYLGGTLDTTFLIDKSRTWEGKPGSIQYANSVNYLVNASLSDIQENTEKTLYDTVSHLYAKQLMVTVHWPCTQADSAKCKYSISVSRILK